MRLMQSRGVVYGEEIWVTVETKLQKPQLGLGMAVSQLVLKT